MCSPNYNCGDSNPSVAPRQIMYLPLQAKPPPPQAAFCRWDVLLRDNYRLDTGDMLFAHICPK
jgi:hypothetical protein